MLTIERDDKDKGFEASTSMMKTLFFARFTIFLFEKDGEMTQYKIHKDYYLTRSLFAGTLSATALSKSSKELEAKNDEKKYRKKLFSSFFISPEKETPAKM